MSEQRRRTGLAGRRSEEAGARRRRPSKQVAFVTGASRGIGKACAVYLAKAGFDVAVTARTVREGEEREHSSTVKKSDTRPLPGSLDATAERVRAEGREALTVPADLLEPASLARAVETVLGEWDRIDVLVNNGRYIGPGHMDRFLDTPLELLDAHLQANVMSPLLLTQRVLPQMVERGRGFVVDISSAVAWMDPPAPPGEGGWGLGYSMSKAALHRVVPSLHVELHDAGIQLFNIDPGFIATERMALDMADFGFDSSAGAPPDVIGTVVAWLTTEPAGAEWAGKVVPAQQLCAELGLVPGFNPVPNPV